jgi:endonuclease/exonuclease/phosphatase family metal-dependent hydrolase
LFVVLTLNIWGFGQPYDYAIRRGITRGAVPGSAATKRPATAEAVWVRREALIVSLIRAIGPDVVGLQEVGRSPDLLGGVNAADRVAAALGWERVSSLAVVDKVVEEERGLAILSPRTLEPLGDVLRDGEYGALAARVGVADGGSLVFVTAHLPLDRGPQVSSERRAACTSQVLAWCEAVPKETPLVVAGDLNSAPGTGTVEAFLEAGFSDAGTESTGQPIRTMPSHDPVVPLDYILVRGARVLGCRAVGGDPDAEGHFPSDHLGLAADLLAVAGPS